MTTKRDAILAEAVPLARAEVDKVAEPGTVGEYLGMDMLGGRLAMHWFECLSPGYRGWRWGASVARVSRSRTATVCETNLLPGPDAILAPDWVPYADRIAPGDLGAGDVLPYRLDDPNLEAGFEATGDEDVDQMAIWELGLGRHRVLSAQGRGTAATRWYEGDPGPTCEIAQQASAPCSTCGYFVPMAGALRTVFGVCANEWSPSDGRVVSLDHGCGAHSEVDVRRPRPASVQDPVLDELAVDIEVHETTEGGASQGDPSTGEGDAERDAPGRHPDEATTHESPDEPPTD
ncbi:DUF3027 domain-containing protein [Intrasporangium sp.]|uniref:DUF3027 domain-containing protein n=1 Tax=Intrasporangium sp. TaxID=1925024 RepID=UPI003464E6EF